VKQEYEDDISDSIKEESPYSVDRETSKLYNDPREYTSPCRFCVCPFHGHKDNMRNECIVKGCDTRFKWKKEHWTEIHANDHQDSIPLLYTLALRSIDLHDLLPREVDEQDLQPMDVLVEMYEQNHSEKSSKCRCIVCHGKQCI